MYNVMSPKAEEFISHEEILDSLEYGEKNKENRELIDRILAKARERRGLSHREAMVLLDCELEDKIQEIFALAEQIKKDFYGNRIVMFAPLYLSNYCVNGCEYCPYHAKNKHIARKKLTQEEIVKTHYPDVEENLMKQAMEIFYDIRAMRDIRKKPSTSELIDWINALQIGGIPADVLRAKMPFLGVVVKKDEDLETVRQHGI